MTRIIHQLEQGSADWHEHRARHFNASEAAAMMGLSPYMTRTELLRQKHSGIAPDVDAGTQRRFDAGHQAEADARPIAEDIIGEPLFPITASMEFDGLNLSASYDGATMDEDIIFEHKLANQDLKASLAEGRIPEQYLPQIEQQLLILGAKKCLFMASNGDVELHAWYESDPKVRATLLSGWRQFAADLAAYVPQEVIPAAVAAPINELPALNIQINGSVVASNLAQWKDVVTARIADISTDLQSDTDFATAERTVKFLEDGEKKIDLVKSQAQAQASDIDAVFRAMDEIKASMRAKRLELDKMVKARKESIRMEIMQAAQAKLSEHVKALNERIGWIDGCPIISPAAADFASAIKGKKTVTSLRDACDTELARVKIATSELADRIEANRKAMGDHAALFPDFAHVCTKAPMDFSNLVAVRVQQHREAEDRRMQERILDEENAKARAALESSPVHAAIHTPPTPLPESSAPVAAIQPRPQPVADSGATLKLGEINARLAPLSVDAAALKALGFEPVGNQGAAKLYLASDFPRICMAILRHVESVMPMRQAA